LGFQSVTNEGYYLFNYSIISNKCISLVSISVTSQVLASFNKDNTVEDHTQRFIVRKMSWRY